MTDGLQAGLQIQPQPDRGLDLASWLAHAWSRPARQSWMHHEGRRLNLREWGRVGDPGVVLVHGSGANSSWWDHIAPWIADGLRIVALDLSGHGDSDWRADGYSLGEWASEVAAVAELVRTPQAAPILVGHSMGGLVVLKAAMRPAAGLAGAVVLDVVAREIGPEEQDRRRRRASWGGRPYASEEEAIASFRTLPDAGENQIPSIVRHVAAASFRQVAEGWVLKADRGIFLRDALPIDGLRAVDFPVCVIAAENGLLTPARAAEMAERLGPRATVAMAPDAGHHLMLDRPIALTDGLRRQLAAWTSA